MSATDIELPGADAGTTGGTDGATDAADATADAVDGGGGGNSLISRLMSTYEPNRTPPQIQGEYEVPKGVALMLYGVLQMAETGGMPAAGNIILGLVLEARSRDLGGDGDGGDDGSDGTSEFEISEVEPK